MDLCFLFLQLLYIPKNYTNRRIGAGVRGQNRKAQQTPFLQSCTSRPAWQTARKKALQKLSLSDCLSYCREATPTVSNKVAHTCTANTQEAKAEALLWGQG